MLRRIIRIGRVFSVCALCAVASLSCSSDPTDVPAGIVGTYQLRLINGLSLPYPLPHTDEVTITEGSVEFKSDSTYVSLLTYHAPDGVTVQPDFGTYRVIADTVDFYDDGHRFARGVFTSSTVEIGAVTGSYFYRK